MPAPVAYANSNNPAPRRSWLRKAWGLYFKSVGLFALGLTAYGHFVQAAKESKLEITASLYDAPGLVSRDNGEPRYTGPLSVFSGYHVFDYAQHGADCRLEIARSEEKDTGVVTHVWIEAQNRRCAGLLR